MFPVYPLYILCTYVYPRNTVYLVYPCMSCLPMFTLVILYTLIFQRCGVSKAMVHFFDIQILEGVSFLKISEGLASLNYRQYLQRRRIYFSARKGNMCSVPDIAEFHNNPLYSFPSNDQIMKIFLHNFEKNRAIYDEEMNRLTVSSLSCDHTFKISRNIGFVREKDNKFVTQFTNYLFA